MEIQKFHVNKVDEHQRVFHETFINVACRYNVHKWNSVIQLLKKKKLNYERNHKSTRKEMK